MLGVPVVGPYLKVEVPYIIRLGTYRLLPPVGQNPFTNNSKKRAKKTRI